MPGGRPPIFSKKILIEAKKYLETCVDVPAYEEKIYDKKKKTTKVIQHPFEVNIPMVEGLAIYLGTHRGTIYRWEAEGEKKGATQDQKEFCDIVAFIRTNKSQRLQHGGLGGKYNSKVASLLLGHEGYREKSDVDVTSGGKPIPTGMSIVPPTEKKPTVKKKVVKKK